VNVSWSGKTFLPGKKRISLFSEICQIHMQYHLDDFGHDSQLPVVLRAMGSTGTAFARIPGECAQVKSGDYGPPGYISAHKILLGKEGGLDFIWKANDGSTVFSHYIPYGYCEGKSSCCLFK
jgi:alpha-mannosidase